MVVQTTKQGIKKAQFFYKNTPKTAEIRHFLQILGSEQGEFRKFCLNLTKSGQIHNHTDFKPWTTKNKNFLLFNHQLSIPSPPNFYPNKYKHTNYMAMTIIQNQRERAKLFQTYICIPKRLRASKIILDIYLYDERAKRREPANYF